MRAIWKRELKSYFQTVTGWLFIAATLALFGLYFYVYNMFYGSTDISNTLSAVTFLFLVTVPILTMRTLAEERKNKTDQLILTSPVSVEKVVLAKYLATGTVFTISVAVMCLTPLIMSAYGSVAFAKSYVGVLGFWLYGMTCIAIGTFVSSLTESIVISAVLTFVFLFVGYLMTGITNLISQNGNIITKILGCYDLTKHMDMLMQGILDVSGIVYYISMIILFLFLTVQSIQKRRWSMSSKKLKLGVFSSAMVVIGIVVTVAVNLVVNALPSSITSIDLTAQKMYSISDDTKEIPYYLLPNVESSALTSGVDGYVFTPYAVGLTYNEDTENVTYTPLLTTSDAAYSKTDATSSLEQTEDDIAGPFTVGLKAEKTLDDTSADILVYSSVSMFTDDADSMVSGNNLSVFSKSIASYIPEDSGSTVVIPVKEYDSSTLTVPASVVIASAVIGIAVIPLMLLVIGIIIWMRRRKK